METVAVHSRAPDANAQQPNARSRTNLVLAALSPEARAHLVSHLRIQTLPERYLLWECGSRPERIWFPVSALVSVLAPTPAGTALEVGSVGFDGALGFDGHGPSFTRATVRSAGIVASLPVQVFATAAAEREELRRLEAVCREWLTVQAQQASLCHATHTAEARFARYLMRAAEFAETGVVTATQETAAEMLGLRRTTVTLIAGNLQAAGIIRYRRGVITICDPAALRATACPCTEVLGRDRWPSEILLRAGSRAAGSSDDGAREQVGAVRSVPPASDAGRATPGE
ncbi:transcriptional regulator, Crp/Fnr family [Rhodovulum sp. PH10]|uniref:Crp/Fnr family transcriptional regulator n=1 Tax=Rhodovulum sp. PH10 TaxID=1187851 RepID=UPI00027C2623|nr:Crp/Fnr family transcriptional regulator [Rhodovulum sp. PH10]EJW12650.1 transcriptional regulator, Crp/Fnr family [Rhodovulum sp. PH10]